MKVAECVPVTKVEKVSYQVCHYDNVPEKRMVNYTTCSYEPIRGEVLPAGLRPLLPLNRLWLREGRLTTKAPGRVPGAFFSTSPLASGERGDGQLT